MTPTTAHKRLAAIETHLTPKEWAIRLAGEPRKYPDLLAHLKALVKLPLHELPVQRPYLAFEKQAAERHPGNQPEDIRARHRLTDALWNEFHTLKLLIRRVNQAMRCKAESMGLQAALRLSALHALVLQDALAQTKTPSDRVPPQDQPTRYPAPLAEWHHELTALLKDFFAHRAAVELVQGQHFDGHPILFLDVEAEWAETARTLESAVATANEYLKRRAALCHAEPNRGASESYPAIALESIQASAGGQRAAAIAEQWLREARDEAVEMDAAKWERCREEFGANR
jgi:hypothetical protein